MAAITGEPVTYPLPQVPDAEPAGRWPVLKVYLPPTEKAAFIAEARRNRQDASDYARFILGARSDPILFVQLARLLNPGFLAGFAGNPADAGRVAELEKQVLTLTHERDDAARDRDEAEKRAAAVEAQLAESMHHQRRLAAYVADLGRVDGGNRARAMAASEEVEAIPRELLLVVGALAAGPLTRKGLEERLTADGLTPEAARAAILQADAGSIITKGRDSRYRLARQPTEGDDE